MEIVDDQGRAVPDATVEWDGDRWSADSSGIVRIHPVEHAGWMVVRGPQHLDEPVVIGASDLGEQVRVRLWRDEGRRWSLHAAGDVMLGRRYIDPSDGEPLLTRGDGGASAEQIVRDVRAGFAAATWRTVNLETVIGDLPAAEAYPGKRWHIQSPPEALAALSALRVDAVGLANNHLRDWLDVGVAETLGNLDAADLRHLGATVADEPSPPLTLDGAASIAMFAYTSVNGDAANDPLPQDDDVPPDPIAPDDAWMWTPRDWGHLPAGIPREPRRIGSAWRVIEAAEATLDAPGRAALWASAIAVYPELQDWVARRGHGGATPWSADAIAQIAEAAVTHDAVIVQIHNGYQFATVPSASARDAARDAIAAGADLVITHHPHVLQGVEWYEGKLIFYSLGNFVFDQDLLPTFPGGFLRTVWDGDEIVEARLLPTLLDGYRPVPSAGALADFALRGVWESSVTPASSQRGADGVVRALAFDSAPIGGGVWLDQHAATFVPEATAPEPLDVHIPCDAPARLPPGVLIRRRLHDAEPRGVWVGRALDGYGALQDEDGDRTHGDVPGWTWSSADIEARSDGFGRPQSLTLRRDGTNDERVSARLVARIPLLEQRLWLDELTPADGTAHHSVSLDLDPDGHDADFVVRVATYLVDDTDPTQEPTAVSFGEFEQTVARAAGRCVHWLDIPDSALVDADGRRANAVQLILSANPPAWGEVRFHVHEVEWVEWRDAAEEPDGYARIDWLKAAPDACGRRTVDHLPGGAR